MIFPKILRSPVFWLLLIFVIIFREFFFSLKIPFPGDALVGSYFPWLDYKWGYAVGVPVKNPLISDVFSAFYPWKKLALDQMLHGKIPLWNRFSFSGNPLLATFHTAVLFPANILLLLPQNFGWGLYIFFSLFASALTMNLFLSTLVKSKFARLVGALIYAFAGPMTTWGEFGTAAWSACLLPLVLFFLDRLIVSPRRLYYLLLPLSLMILIFGGHVQILSYTFLIAPLYFLYRQKTFLGRFDATLTVRAAFSFFLGISLGAVQLLPSLEFFRRSIRTEENYLVTYNYGLSDFSQLIRLWAADFFGNPATINHFSSFSYHEYSSYLGVLTLPLITSYLFTSKVRKNFFFIILFFVILLLTFENPVSLTIFGLHIPLLTFSSASRLFFILNLAAAVLVALSLEELLCEDSYRLIRLAAFVLIPITLLAVLFIDKSHQLISLRNSVLYVALLALFLIGSFLLAKKKTLFLLLIVFIYVFDLSRYFSKYNPFVSPSLIFPETPLISFLKDQSGPFRIAVENTNLFPANTWINYGIASIQGYDPLYINDYAHFFHRVNGDSYFNGVSRYASLEGFKPDYLDTTNTRYILVKSKDGSRDRLSPLELTLRKNGYPVAFTDRSVTVYENKSVKERAFFVDQVRLVTNQAEVGKTLDDTSFDPTKEALTQLPVPSTLTGKNQVISIAEDDSSVTVVAAVENGGFLVLSDTYDPGWKVYLDGKPSLNYEVDGALMGVFVPKGRSEIVFRYEPSAFRYGLLISLASILLLLIQYTRIKVGKIH